MYFLCRGRQSARLFACLFVPLEPSDASAVGAARFLVRIAHCRIENGASPGHRKMSAMKQMLWRRFGVGCLLVFGIATTSIRAADGTPAKLEASACAALQGFQVPTSAIGLPTSGAVVQTAVAVSASDPGNIERRLLQGDRHRQAAARRFAEPRVRGQPAARLESARALQMGGGGYDGSLVTGLCAVHAAAAEHGHAAEAGLRHARQRRRPQRQARDSTAASRSTTKRSSTTASSRSRRRTTPPWP